MSSVFKKIAHAPRVLCVQLTTYWKWLLFKIAKNWVVLNRISPYLRPWLWKRTGVNINGKVKIGYDVYYDVSNANLITIEEGAWITSRCLFLCHKRDLSNYREGDDINKQPYIKREIHVGKGAHIGMGTIVMPGVTIGDGAIIGAGAVVTKNIPAWTIAVGNPAKVIRYLNERSDEQDNNN